MKVGILGGGRWGQALARLAIAAGSEPLIAWRDEKPPHILPSTRRAHEVPEQCDLLIVATSAAQVREAIRLAKPGPGNRIVVAGRGLDPESGRWLTEVVREECDALRVGALAGPAPVDEILNGALCAGVVASPFDEVRQMTVEALHSTRYRVYESADLVGVELAGAFTPVLAALVGLASSLRGAGVGMHAMVVARAFEEGSRLARALGGDPASLTGLAGLGDLVAVQSSEGHPYFRAGAALAAGTAQPNEGPHRIGKALLRRAADHDVDMPLTSALVAVYEGMDPIEAVQGLMGRRAQRERR